MDKNRQRFLAVFLEESREHLETMEACLLAIEAGGAADGETLNRIFRAAHTIKGGSGMFGLETTARFTHSLENLLDQVRGGQLAVTPALVDVLLRSCDVVKRVLDAEHAGTLPPPIDGMLTEIDRESRRTSGSIVAPEGQGLQGASPVARIEAGGNASDSGAEKHLRNGYLQTWRIQLAPSADIFKRGVNPVLAFRELAELGRVFDLRMDTRKVPTLASLDPEENYLGWTLGLETVEPESRIREVFDFLHDGDGLKLFVDDTARSQADSAFADLAFAGIGPSPAPIDSGPDKVAAATEEVFSMQTSISDPSPASLPAGESGSTIRVDVELLDRLMNKVGELVLARNQIIQFSNTAEDPALITASQRLNLITSELQEGVMKTRMQPIGVAWSMMPRLVRDLAQTVGKHIQLEMEGSETELDRTIIEAIKDPLTHLVRNSCDHGLEGPKERQAAGKPVNGKLLLRAFHEGGHVIIEISDDGQGISLSKVKNKALERNLLTAEQAGRLNEREAIHLIFLPGFSTAEKISGISGRGVGMDVVKTNIERIGGNVDISSREGQGTTIRIKIPLTLAIIPGMVVDCSEEIFVVPQVSLVELVRLEEGSAHERIDQIHGAPVCRLRGKLLPLAYLSHILGIRKPAATAQTGAVSIVVLQAEERQFGLVVDSIRDTQEIVVKPLGKQLKGLSAYSGATVMGDGRVVLILDVPGLAQLAGFSPSHYTLETRAAGAPSSETDREPKQAILLFRSRGYDRMAVPLALVSRLEEIPRSRIEISGGLPVMQYRGRILQLTGVDANGITGQDAPDPLQVIVFLDGARSVGLVVDEILDIVEETVTVRKESRTDTLIGTAVVADRVTDFINLRWVFEKSGQRWTGNGAMSRTGTVLVADHARFNRALLRSVVEMAGHRVVEAATPTELLAQIQHQAVDVVALSADFEQAKAAGSLIGLIRSQNNRSIRVLGIGSSTVTSEEFGFDAQVESYDDKEFGERLRELMGRA